MEAILKNHIRDIITENVIKEVDTIGCTLKYFIRNYAVLERVSSCVELLIYSHHFDQFKDQMQRNQVWSSSFSCPRSLDHIIDLKCAAYAPDAYIPKNVTTLATLIPVGDPVDWIPSQITHLSLQSSWIEHDKCSTITSLPQGLVSLTMIYNWKRPFRSGLLPSSLKVLDLGESRFDQDLADYLPGGLEKLQLATHSIERSNRANFHQLSNPSLADTMTTSEPLEDGVFPQSLRS
ncbi:hypothetical protein CYY_009129 [Polysphondylium violaceum]|uniref:FNIP repeat-containing protein n=1 Tax=Polysphondylium violaceum TaxID=133409 RepID=A0A8J4PKP5_9MYCE|nr:hypothetical protein CYY_009129 [Polysphondylium violaceum]